MYRFLVDRLGSQNFEEIIQIGPVLLNLISLQVGLVHFFSKFQSKRTEPNRQLDFKWNPIFATFTPTLLKISREFTISYWYNCVGQKGGCIIVDSTRKGKRFPDSMSKTIPIWTCVLNRAIQRYRNRLLQDINSSRVNHESSVEPSSVDWDCALHLPLFVSKTERSSIESRLEEFTKKLEESGADIASLATTLRKPLRPLWISQKSVIWLNEVPDHDSWDFTPIILVSASSQESCIQHRESSEFSWNYIPGAGDDEESWSRGLTPFLFWKNVYDLINCEPSLCNRKVSEIVETDRVYRAQRGLDAPQISVKTSLSSARSNVNEELALRSEFEDLGIGGSSSSKGDSEISWLGSTNVAVSATRFGNLI